jgi:peptidoglycan/xylan/chitin deacetylase (PgdA/CDA1 family)
MGEIITSRGVIMWPDGAQCVVCLTFDFDAESSWKNILKRHKIQRENPVVLSLGQYGAKAGVPRILRLLKKMDVKAGFFIPGVVAEAYQDIVKQIHNEGHEISHHGYTHQNPARYSKAEEKAELDKGIYVLQELIGEAPKGYRAPAADLSENTHQLLVEHGFIYDSTMMGDDLPYLVEVAEKTLVELPIRWILDDWVYFGFNYFPPLEYQSGISSHRKVYEIWVDEFNAVYDEGLYFMLTMHPQIMGIPSRARMLEKLISHMQKKKNVWFATPLEISLFWKKREVNENAKAQE